MSVQGTASLPAGHVGKQHKLVKLAVFDMSCFVPFSQFLEEEERNEFGTIAVGDPVAWISIVKTVEIEIILAKVQRLCDVPHEHNIIERTRTLLVQDCI